MSQMCDIEQMDEEEQQAKELELFSTIVRAPLQILDLNIPDPIFYHPKSTGNGREEDYILSVILKNFSGTQLKLSNLLLYANMRENELDFDWECKETLRYFKLYLPHGLQTEIIEVISRKLSEMPSLVKVKFDQLWTQ